MARIDTLTNFLTDVADSIRTKTNKTDNIHPKDFDTEIESIPTPENSYILVTASANALLTCDDQTYQLTNNETKHTFTVTLGNHTVTSTKNGETLTQTVNVDVTGVYEISLIHSKLPLEYQEVSYIQSTGEQGLDTSIIAADIGKWVLDVQFDTLDDQINGVLKLTGNKAFDIGVIGNKFFMRNGASNDVSVAADTLRHTFIIDVNTSQMFIDGVIVSTARDTIPSYTLHFFERGGTSPTYKCYEKFYKSQIYNWEGILLADFIPCYRISDGKTGLFNVVNNQFYISNTGVEFVLGEDV